jgi:hypothetical protein
MKNYDLQKKDVEVELKPLSEMSDEEMLDLRNEIDSRLNIAIADLNLTEELGLQYRQGKVLLSSIQNDKTTPANQKAQVFNSVGAQLGQIVKMQSDVFSMQRLKKFEIAFIKAAETLPQAAKEAFFDLYGEYLKDKGK